MDNETDKRTVGQKIKYLGEVLGGLYLFCAAAALPAGLIFGYPIYLLFSSHSRPRDVNGDGLSTISDLSLNAWHAFSEGAVWMLSSGDGRWLRFLEIDPQAPGGVIFFVFCLAFWFFVGFIIAAAFSLWLALGVFFERDQPKGK